MGIMDTAALIIGGQFDVFDRAAGMADFLLEQLKDANMDTELHAPGLFTEAHFFDPKVQAEAMLLRAKELIREACDICQNVSAAM